MNSDLFLIDCGSVTVLDVDTDLPAAAAFGSDWLVVEADDADDALAVARSVDAWDALAKIAKAWNGAAVDRVLWHLSEGADVDGVEELFIRYGAAPRDGVSVDHSTGRAEAGLSVYSTVEVDGGYALDDSAIRTPTALFLIAAGAEAYLVAGVRVATGSDGEPVIAGYRLVCPLTRDGSRYAKAAW